MVVEAAVNPRLFGNRAGSRPSSGRSAVDLTHVISVAAVTVQLRLLDPLANGSDHVFSMRATDLG
jgi:hypothetical protein